ncbi:MAG: hypothetical protein ACOX29_10495 [Bacillota bacterium]|nr:hypothetical protein [Bacillota bacterium]NLU53860.1 hypothetical protein [Bacillota bacterium]HOA91195.1 hypothetical protein [Bacillota bacterium]HOL14423.1 hypothetical protein [Bacillota bacterium]HOP53384.1 hypothetical protein [Bacillota bacterium]
MRKLMKRFLVAVLVVAFLALAVSAVDNRFVRDDIPLKRLVGPGGIYMQLSQYNSNYSIPSIVGYEVELAVFTPEFEDQIRTVPVAFMKVFVVIDDVITEILNRVPKIPENGYLVVGHGRAGSVFMEQFKVGDRVKVEDYEPVYDFAEYPKFVVLPDGTKLEIDAWNRHRDTDEIIIYNTDFADRTYTNEWGIEIAVERGEVVEIRKQLNTEPLDIPRKGFVISVHGKNIPYFADIVEYDYIELE